MPFACAAAGRVHSPAHGAPAPAARGHALRLRGLERRHRPCPAARQTLPRRVLGHATEMPCHKAELDDGSQRMTQCAATPFPASSRVDHQRLRRNRPRTRGSAAQLGSAAAFSQLAWLGTEGTTASELSDDGVLHAVVATTSAPVSLVSHLLDAVVRPRPPASSRLLWRYLVIATLVVTHICLARPSEAAHCPIPTLLRARGDDDGQRRTTTEDDGRGGATTEEDGR